MWLVYVPTLNSWDKPLKKTKQKNIPKFGYLTELFKVEQIELRAQQSRIYNVKEGIKFVLVIQCSSSVTAVCLVQ